MHIIVKIFTFISLEIVSNSAFKIVPFIYGGFFARPNQFPYQAALYTSGRFGCGAIIYNEKFILSAAHCVISDFTQKVYDPKNLEIRVGVTDLDDENSGSFHSVKNVISHSGYFDDRNDISVIEVVEPLKFSESVQPIELYTGNLPSGSEVTISGWGLNEGGYMLPHLKYHQLKTNIQPNCGKKIGDDYGGFLCVEHEIDNGMCFGDSGGPAMVDGKLVGIANLVIWDCGTERPDVYLYIPFYIDWIKNNTVPSS